MALTGRTKITTDFTQDDLLNEENVKKLVNDTMSVHLMNKSEIDYLVEYKNGIQKVLTKEKLVRPEINNKLVLNHAQMTTRMIVGYFLGTPIQYIHADGNNKPEIDQLNRYLSYEDKASVDKEIGEDQSITGTAYRLIFTDGALGDEVPFEQVSLNPSTTYVVYENSLASKPICGVTFHSFQYEGEKAFKVYVYTEKARYTIICPSELLISDKAVISDIFYYDVGGVPIIEYPNNKWRIGDWELCITLMDAINALHSGRLDDIEQTVQSLLVFLNVDIDKDRYAEMREAGVVMLNSKGLTNGAADVKSLINSLDQTGMNLLAKELESLLYNLIGIPDRENRSGGGADTGAAVELRDGWADLETVVRNKELCFKKSEKQALVIMLSILKNKLGFSLSLMDIDIKFSRNKNNNLLVKTQSYGTLLLTKTIDPADALMICDLVSDESAFVARGKAFWGDDFAGMATSKAAIESSKKPQENTTATGDQSGKGDTKIDETE